MREDEAADRRSSPLAWTLGVLVVPLMYFLSYPWISAHAFRHNYFSSAAFHIYGALWNWVYNATPLSGPLAGYSSWCWENYGY